MISPTEVIAFLQNQVLIAENAPRFLEIVRSIRNAEIRSAVILRSLPVFIAFRPSVEALNLLIAQVPKDGVVHQEIMLATLEYITDFKDAAGIYLSLVRPADKNLTTRYKTAKTAFRKKHPDVISRWNPIRWIPALR
jgi:hypothetical protein